MRLVLEHPEVAPLAAILPLAYLLARTKWGRRLWTRTIILVNPLASRVAAPSHRPSRLLPALEALVILLVALALAGPALEYKETVYGEAESRSKIQVPPRPGLVLVIDASGSMVGWKIEAVKSAAIALVDGLDPRIDVGFIAFEAKIKEAAPPTDDREIVKAAISRVQAGGGTMFSYPLTTALTWLSVYRELGLPAAIILLSDGIPADRSLIPPLVERASGMGITIHTIYTGDTEMGASLLRDIAEATGGLSIKVGSEDKLLEAFETIGERVNSSLIAGVTAEAVLRGEVTVRKPLAPYMSLAALALATLATFYRHLVSGLAF